MGRPDISVEQTVVDFAAEFLIQPSLSACGAPVSRLDGTFCRVNVTIDYLEVRRAPIVEQIRPRRFPVLAPNPKQRDAVVNFGALPQPSAALAAAPPLQSPEELGVAIRRVPKLPRDHAGAVPVRIHIGAGIPQIDMPTEAIDRLAARSRIPNLVCMRVRDRGRVAFDMRPATHACRCCQAARSSYKALRSEQRAHAPADRRGSDVHANTNLRQVAVSAARKGGRVPKTELPMEKCVAMPC
jgi:hypothetical protein